MKIAVPVRRETASCTAGRGIVLLHLTRRLEAYRYSSSNSKEDADRHDKQVTTHANQPLPHAVKDLRTVYDCEPGHTSASAYI